MRRLLPFVALLGLALAQVPVGVNLPAGSALTLSADRIVFDVARRGYPPPAFPAYYAPTDPEGALMLRLFSNLEGGWFLSASLDVLSGEAGLLPPEQIEIRIDGASWIPLGPEVLLLSGEGTSRGYDRHAVELRLKLTGREAPGRYEGRLLFTLAKP